MALNCVFIIVGNMECGEYIQNLTESVRCIGGELSYVTYTKCDKDTIKKELITATDACNLVIMIGNSTTSKMYNIVNKAIREVTSKNISEDLKKSLTTFEQTLTHVIDWVMCGIRKKTFIINLCGSYVTAVICFRANSEKILHIVHLIAQSKTINNNNDDNFNVFSHCISNEDMDMVHTREPDLNVKKEEEDTEMKEVKNPVTSFDMPNQDIIKISLKDAVQILRSLINESGEEIRTDIVNTDNACGRILGEDIYADCDVPAFKTCAKQGYAVLASDGKGKRKVLRADSTSAPISLVPGTCMRVKSGTPLPDGATAVVLLKDIKILLTGESDSENSFIDTELEVEVLITPKENDNIREAGCEIEYRDLILMRYTVIGPADMGILALCGRRTVKVIKIPSVGILSIGDELEEPGEPLKPKHIYDGNRIVLLSLLRQHGYDPVDFGILPYEMMTIMQKIEKAMEIVDVIAIIGHPNDKDLLKSFIESYFAAFTYFNRVNMKPGKSTTFLVATIDNKKKYFLCMSSNLATVPVVAHTLLLPLLNELHCNFNEHPVMQTCIQSQQNLHPRPRFSWTKLRWNAMESFPRAYSIDDPDFSLLKYRRANALLMLPPRSSDLSAISAAFVPAMYIK